MTVTVAGGVGVDDVTLQGNASVVGRVVVGQGAHVRATGLGGTGLAVAAVREGPLV